jgi:SAM-dependent methyltransferase
MISFEEVRQRERGYHVAYYAKHGIGDEGTWLAGPSPYVIESFQYIQPSADKALDLGAGIGRHAFTIAERLGKGSTVVCVDLLDSALEKLIETAKEKNVGANIITVDSDVADYEPDTAFDYVLSVSVIEHLPNKQSLTACLKKLQQATNTKGVHCFMIAVDHKWTDRVTGETVEPLVEQNLTTAETKDLLNGLYKEWDIKDLSEKHWEQTESVNGRDVICASTCIQFTAIKSEEE